MFGTNSSKVIMLIYMPMKECTQMSFLCGAPSSVRMLNIRTSGLKPKTLTAHSNKAMILHNPAISFHIAMLAMSLNQSKVEVKPKRELFHKPIASELFKYNIQSMLQHSKGFVAHISLHNPRCPMPQQQRSSTENSISLYPDQCCPEIAGVLLMEA